jgi:hypothetical protein
MKQSTSTKIMPSSAEYKVLRTVTNQLTPICPDGKKCETCFIHYHINGESCCPISHLKSMFQEITDEIVEKALSPCTTMEKTL